ncbi:MAG: YciI family protein [Polyangiaceae bacterium]|nr:YciI family protein [Polyangiaceae bacterium]
MQDYILLMHNDADHLQSEGNADLWSRYLDALKASGCFQGGSAIGSGACVSKAGTRANITGHLAGYIRISARDLNHAQELVLGNPVYEAGGTVEIRELPKS